MDIGTHDGLVVILRGQVHQSAGIPIADGGEPFHHAVFQSEHRFIVRTEGMTFTLRPFFRLGEVIHSKHDVLARDRDRLTVGWRKDIVAAQHEH